jgi:hypothetical protein
MRVRCGRSAGSAVRDVRDPRFGIGPWRRFERAASGPIRFLEWSLRSF